MTTDAAARPTPGTAAPTTPADPPQSRLPRPRLSARAHIFGWVLLLVLAALGVVTFVSWRLLLQTTDARMETALLSEVAEFREVVTSGLNPRDGQAFRTVDDVIDEAIAYNPARPNEKFLGYVGGTFSSQSRQSDGTAEVLEVDPAFTALVADVVDVTPGRYDSAAGEVMYLAVPVRLDGDPNSGVIVAAYLADAERDADHDTARVMLVVGAVTAVAVAGAAWLVAGRVLRPVRDVAETARAITETDLSRRITLDPPDPDPHGPPDHDEIRDLVRTVNAMLDRVENGVAAQRRFVDDAGHELRTPITIVRGHLDVLDVSDPADVRSTIELVDDELDRMNRLVSDLLLLAKSDQPQFLRPEEVHVGELTEDVFGHVRRLGDRTWVLESRADVDAVLDPQRITQAVVALADNAVHHTEPGDRIGVGSRLDDGGLRFWVSDSGPGVTEAERDRIFERFARGTTIRRSEGAGLGLSIIKAIAVAHGGQVLLDSVEGEGATFTVAVPVHATPPEPINPEEAP